MTVNNAPSDNQPIDDLPPAPADPECKKCPDKAELDNKYGVYYITYTGGPPHAPFAVMRQAIPAQDEIIRRFERPTVGQDGYIRYNKNGPVPPVPAGYEADPGDPWTLRPVWSSCMFRLYRVQLHDEGYLQVDAFCAHPGSGKPKHEKITPADCEKCGVCVPIRQWRPSSAGRSAGNSGGSPNS
jgi:hypothetical protein